MLPNLSPEEMLRLLILEEQKKKQKEKEWEPEFLYIEEDNRYKED